MPKSARFHQNFVVKKRAEQLVFIVLHHFHSWISLAAVQCISSIALVHNFSNVRCIKGLITIAGCYALRDAATVDKSQSLTNIILKNMGSDIYVDFAVGRPFHYKCTILIVALLYFWTIVLNRQLWLNTYLRENQLSFERLRKVFLKLSKRFWKQKF